jgi:uncharacterized damage-inducible protein DinB
MTPPVVTAVVRQISELVSVVQRLNDETYGARLAAASGPIGAQVRHSLDHISALVEAVSTGACWYDRRERGTDVERRRASAIRVARSLACRLLVMDEAILQRRVTVHVQVDTAGECVAVDSTVERELGFLHSHTVHHNAIIALLLEQAGVTAPGRFGVAVSTPAPALSACALSR